MKVHFIEEPELQFGVGQHVDIRFGIKNYQPFDFDAKTRPSTIRGGIVGTPESIEGVCRWVDKCRSTIAGKTSRKPMLFPSFPGFAEDTCFRCQIILDDTTQRSISPRKFAALGQIKDHNRRIEDAVGLFVEEIAALAEKAVDVIVCALPTELISAMAQSAGDAAPPTEDEDDVDTDVAPAMSEFIFHDLLKARIMAHGKPIQVVRPSTYDETMLAKECDAYGRQKKIQDEATRAWNFFTALYYKAGGYPWRLPRLETDLDSCFVGVSFYESLDRKRLLTSIAQVFNERGLGVIVRGAEAARSKDDRQIHMAQDAAHDLIRDALQTYRREHRNLPARVVVHKTSVFNVAEKDGVEAALREASVEQYDLVSFGPSLTRLFRSGYYPPLRGTFFDLDSSRGSLYARGSVEFYREYPGMYIPKPLLLRYDSVSESPLRIAGETLALTKMNWNNTQSESSLPITVRASRQVGQILKYIGDEEFQHLYKFFM